MIDAGEGNNGAAISLSLGDTPVDATINNAVSGVIQGRSAEGEPLPASSPQAGDGIRLEGVRGTNAEGGVAFAPSTFTGVINNNGLIASGDNVVGTTAGFRAVNGVSFQGTLNNTGQIDGAQNGVYFGNPVGEGGGDHTGGVVNNSGLITSDSRALNIDGTGLRVNNSGSILGTGDQRNGTVYIDGTADDVTINNNGLIDAGEGNSGSGVSIQVGAANPLGDGTDDVETSAVINNTGLIQGRGTEQVPNGVRLFVGSGLEEATFSGQVNNSGTIASETAAGILIEEGVIFNGQIVNSGTIQGGNGIAIDATGAEGQVNIVNNETLEGSVILGNGDDIFVQNSDEGVEVTGGAGDDTILGGAGDDTLIGGEGIDSIDGGEGTDTVDFSDATAGVIVDLDVNSAGGAGTPSQDGGILDAPPAAGGQVIEEIDDVENIIGSDFNDGLFGNNEINVLIGGAGNDVIHSFGGADTLDGGEGIDTALFSAGGGVEVDLDDDGNATSSFGDTLISIENINGSNAGSDIISGNGFVNILNGLGGDDTLNGEGGDDILTGGAGSDTFVFDANSGIDLITDFVIGEDVLDFSSIFNTTVAALGAATEDSIGTTFQLAEDSFVTLENVALSDLATSDVIV